MHLAWSTYKYIINYAAALACEHYDSVIPGNEWTIEWVGNKFKSECYKQNHQSYQQ